MTEPDRQGHAWVDAPPGTATGQACKRCGIRFANPKASVSRCSGFYETVKHTKPAIHDFNPYQ